MSQDAEILQAFREAVKQLTYAYEFSPNSYTAYALGSVASLQEKLEKFVEIKESDTEETAEAPPWE